MAVGGFAGKILFVDLTQKQVRTQPLEEAAMRDYIGGLGTCIKLAADHMRPGVDPLAPESVFVLGAGPLVGTDAPSSSRLYAVARLPASRTVGWCGAGGYRFGAQMKYAGYDHIVISGRSETPVWLDIEDDRVRIVDAGSLWGLGVEAAGDRLRQRIGASAGVLAIGPAGENRSVMAMAFVDAISTLGRGGFGAVMGSKNLKAIGVRGSGAVGTADAAGFEKRVESLVDAVRTYPYLQEWQDLGMLKAFPVVDKAVYEKFKLRRTACVSCPVGCKDIISIPDGPFAGLEKQTSSAINLFTPLLYGIKDPAEAIKLVTVLDSLGLDMFEFFGLMKLMRDLYNAGVARLETGEPEFDLTSLSSMMFWAEKTANREGTGDLLADGITAVLDRFGPKAEKYAPPVIKGMQPYAGPGAAIPWDRFGTMELGQVLDPRGPHVGSGGSPTYFALRPLSVFPKHLKRMGVPDDALDRILGPGRDELHVGRLLKFSHAWFAILGSLGICARGQVNRFYSADRCAKLYEAATGIPTTTKDLVQRADRIWTLLRQLNAGQGLDEFAEALPEKWFAHPGFKDYLTGKPLTRAEAEAIKDEYFREWGWR